MWVCLFEMLIHSKYGRKAAINYLLRPFDNRWCVTRAQSRIHVPNHI